MNISALLEHYSKVVWGVYGILVLAAVAAFASIFIANPAFATVQPCILTLDSGSKTIDVSGSARITASSCAIRANSASTPAISASESGSISAGAVCAPGGAQKSGSAKITPNATTNCTALADPFASATKPTVGACNFTNLNHSSSGNRTLSPGVYCGTTTLAGAHVFTLQPGIYIIKDGTLKIDGSARLTGSGVVFFLTGNSSKIQIGGSTRTTLSAPAGGTLAGFAIYRDPAASGGTSSITGSAQLTLTGAVYLPNQTLQMDGSARITASSLAAFVVNKLKVLQSASLQAMGAIPFPPSDTQAPVIAPHGDVFAEGDENGATVIYSNPTATDNVDASVTVNCTPASGSVFAVGTTTVTCTAEDSAGNDAIPTTFQVIVTVPPPPDTEAPVIAPHENISVQGTNAGATVTYTNPTATDNVDPSVVVTCTPPSGSFFTVGTTTVTCTAEDAAGNDATPTTFDVGVFVPPPEPILITAQSDESFLCSPDWENCFTGGQAQVMIPLGSGADLDHGSLHHVTIAKDENSPFVNQPWIIQLLCYTDNTYSTTCSDWIQPNAWNGFRTYLVSESATSTVDNKHWTAYFTDPTREANSGGSHPVLFRPEYFYQLIINDNGWNIGAYGQETPAIPFYEIWGMTI